ncbi:MAG: AI-2E family transporter [Bacteroidales bacterium]
MKDLKTTNTLLLILVIPVVFYLLKILSFIFIPLVLSMFIALLFLPLMRWLAKKHIPKVISIAIVILILVGIIKIGGELIKLSSQEILSADSSFFERAETKATKLLLSFEDFFGVQRAEGEKVLNHYLKQNSLVGSFKSTFAFIQSTLSITMMTVFFVVLLLAGSLDFQNLMNRTLIKDRFSSIKAFMKIEHDIIRFVKVKFFISLFTGIGISSACVIFDVSFPVFWGLIAFVLNFIQMIGSILSVIVLSAFAMVDLEFSSQLFFFILSITSVQVLMGGILDPIFMGKTFSVNVITILVMLMLWGYIWGVAGMIMAVPLTVFIKIILEQFPRTQIIAQFLSGKNTSVKLLVKKPGQD